MNRLSSDEHPLERVEARAVRLREAVGARVRVEDVGLEEHLVAVGVLGEPFEPVDVLQLRVDDRIEELEPVLLRVVEVLDPLGREQAADDVRAPRRLGPADRDRPVRVDAVSQRREARGVARLADHRVAEDLGVADLGQAVGREAAGRRVVHGAEAAGVRAERLQPRLVEQDADLGDRRLAPPGRVRRGDRGRILQRADVLRELEELDPVVAVRLQELERLQEAARKRHGRAEVGRIGRVVRAAEEAHRRSRVRPR